MPKIALRYVGDDKEYAKKHEATGGVVFMEPMDAREVLASENPDYEVDEDQRQLIGQVFDPARAHDLSVPQLQGADAELQTGHSHMKYARDQVVKAVPDGSTASRPMSTSGKPLGNTAEEEDSSGEDKPVPAKRKRR